MCRLLGPSCGECQVVYLIITCFVAVDVALQIIVCVWSKLEGLGPIKLTSIALQAAMWDIGVNSKFWLGDLNGPKEK